ncbi:helix-turn-helix domain-containing protein [Methylicorpusculum sp.]|uniref:helix-turn-helix domain-containing protein n=1 Tax=Methylicorpusculum sp. TaxID=2713644 RepID=UPI0027218AC5|nr:helix-turn-helix domain-containing protein [Methylicorpusculum sp.]MDO8844118.1 helix-turn-helix domain-containing protein [Methylicorpusculum sp.]
MKSQNYFAKVPIEVLRDNRISKTELRVLCAILSFMPGDKSKCWPKRSTIAERCGIATNKISTATSRLAELGWIRKTGDGGKSCSSLYEFTFPLEFSESVTDTDLETLTDSVTPPLINSVIRKKEIKEIKKKRGIDESGFDQFWDIYPNQSNRYDAEIAWACLNPEAGLQEQILTAVREAKQSNSQWARENGRFIPNPGRYLRERRWEDQFNKSKNELNHNVEAFYGTANTRKTGQNHSAVIAREIDEILARARRNNRHLHDF